MDFGRYKLPFGSSNFLIWAIVIFIIIGFGSNCDILGINLFGPQKKIGYGNGKNCGNGYAGGMVGNKNQVYPTTSLGGNNGFLGGNGLFLLALIAIIFICKDDRKPKDYVDEDSVSCEEIVEE